MTVEGNIAEEKKALRKLIKERKRQYSGEELDVKSDAIFTQVEQLPEFAQSKCVLAYMALADEVRTQNFVKKWVGKKIIVLPIVKGDELELRELAPGGNLEAGESFGILEPLGGRLVSVSEIDFAIIPGVAFDMANNRMGRGRGYYDKLLSVSQFYKIGVCFDFQIVEYVPVAVFDEKMNKVVIA